MEYTEDFITNAARKFSKDRKVLEKKINYKFIKCYWEMFSIMETINGIDGILFSFDEVFDKSKMDVKAITELVLVLNLKIWEWYGYDDNIGRTYDALWKKADGYAMDTLKDDDLHYYLSTLD
ncbi:MAG: hypothetical protein MJZ09_02705 [Bacteroidales bacterium]|nr:hypothetical protein [Bacteroidales bacterium]